MFGGMNIHLDVFSWCEQKGATLPIDHPKEGLSDWISELGHELRGEERVLTLAKKGISINLPR